MAKYRLVSSDDAVRLREMSEQLRKLQPVLLPEESPQVGDAPEVYVVKTPVNGIPPIDGDDPGCAECDVYNLVEIGTGSTDADCDLPLRLTPVILTGSGPYRLHVYNHTTTEVPGETYVVVTREKYGTLIANAPSSGGVQRIFFELTDDIDCSLCQARARVLARPPGVARVYGEDDYGEVMVVDLNNPDGGGYLNEPIDDLVGRRGWATLMEIEFTECALDPAVMIYWLIDNLWCGEGGCA